MTENVAQVFDQHVNFDMMYLVSDFNAKKLRKQQTGALPTQLSYFCVHDESPVDVS